MLSVLGRIVLVDLSEDPSLTTCFFPGRVGMGDGDIQVRVVVVVDPPILASFDYTSIL